MKRIDLIGCPGVGKSTLYELLCSKNNDILSLESAKEKIAKNKIKENSYSFKEIYKRFLLFSKLYKITIINLPDIILNKKKREELFFQHKYIKQFLEFYLNNVNNSKMNEVSKLSSIASFNDCLKNTILVENSKYEDCVLMDESLSHKSILNLIYPNKAETIKYLSLMHKPSALIVCAASPKKIFNRIKKREKETGDILQTYNEIDSAKLLERIQYYLDYYNFIADFMQEMVPVLRLDLDEPTKKNIKKTNDFIKSLLSS